MKAEEILTAVISTSKDINERKNQVKKSLELLCIFPEPKVPVIQGFLQLTAKKISIILMKLVTHV